MNKDTEVFLAYTKSTFTRAKKSTPYFKNFIPVSLISKEEVVKPTVCDIIGIFKMFTIAIEGKIPDLQR